MVSRRTRIVVDASVARSSGQEDATDTCARTCRLALEHVRDVGLKVVMTKAILEEWKQHRSRFAALWLREMYGRRLVENVHPTRQELVGRHIAACEERLAELLTKDLLLVEAALATDERIVSRDTRARAGFRYIATSRPEIRRLHWTSPVEPACCPWLASGAPADPQLQLLP